MNSIWKAAFLSLSFAGLFSVDAFAQDRTLEEFKEHIKRVAGDQINEEQLNQLAKIVDKNGDGTISETEFENRREAFQKVRSGEAEGSSQESDGQGRRARNQNRSGRWEQMNKRMQAQLDNAGISPGKPLPDVGGLDIDGEPFRLADLKGHYSVIVSGCLT